MPDPIFFLDECWRLLRPGLFLAVPDKTYLAFDAKRSLTPLKHLTEDHAKQVREVEDHHIEEFLRLSENLDIPSDTVHVKSCSKNTGSAAFTCTFGIQRLSRSSCRIMWKHPCRFWCWRPPDQRTLSEKRY
jgi:hypothetical protein